MCQCNGFDISRLNPESAIVDLRIHATTELDAAMFTIAPEIAGAINHRRILTRHSPSCYCQWCKPVFTDVTLAHTRTTGTDFTHHTGRYRSTPGIQQNKRGTLDRLAKRYDV